MHVLWKVKSHRYQLSQKTTIIYSSDHFHSHATSSRFRKWGCPILIRILRLDSNTSCVQNGPSLLLDPTPCFLLPIMIKYDRSMTMDTKALLDSTVSAYFINKELMQWHKMIIMKKSTLVAMEVINGQSLSLGLVMHETKALDIIIRTHTSKVAFNVISSSTSPIVIGLSWFILHNPWVDWRIKSFHFDVFQKITSKCEKPTSKNIISEGEDYHLDNLCIKFSECDKYLGSAQDVKSLICSLEQELSCKLPKKEMHSYLCSSHIKCWITLSWNSFLV